MHADARKRFDADPSKCYQRHIRELYGASESREQIRSLDGARVERVTTEEAKSIILKYEWLQSMASGTSACYGLKIGDELIGVACFCCLGGKPNGIKHPVSVFAEDADAYIQIHQREQAEDADDVEEPEDEPVPV
jgi:hypothetical protein